MDPSEKRAFSITEFCRDHDISRGLFYAKLKSAPDELPATFKLGRRRLIATETAEAWRAARSARQ